MSNLKLVSCGCKMGSHTVKCRVMWHTLISSTM